MMAFETVLYDKVGRVAKLTLDHPPLNALADQLMDDLTGAVRQAEADPEIGCIVITGSKKAFAAGADIKEMREKSYRDVFMEDFITRNWEEPSRARKPVIAAVNGYALGGGCEVAMMCDMIFAGDEAVFGQPEIKLGVIPGAGGSQRLTRLVGKAKAMDMILTGRNMKADEALASGLVSRVYPADELVDETMKVAEAVSELSLPAAMIAKEAVNRAEEVGLSEGLRFERRVFHSLFAFEDQTEGMNAFVDKRT
ncbi:MAG: enoyl-CoA hydratase-related protein, partial [Pseudomonadota bacterium]